MTMICKDLLSMSRSCWLSDILSLQVPCACWEGKLWVRISAQLYNTMDEYEALADAILAMAAEPSNS